MVLKPFSIDRTDSFLRLIRRANRGRLKIFLGYGAGVGKTYQMLLEGHRLKAEGIDVAIGLLESHGRVDIEKLSEGLEMIPRRTQDYRGINLEEMDTEAIIDRKPQVVLIDELAHSNAPGSNNAKRYEDVEDILEKGIHVVTTLNIQHLESLYNTVEREVGVKVRERLPDSVLFDADEIVNVDLTPEDLRKRLKEGKIYPFSRIEAALENFFKASNLETLRELTLRELAAQIDLKRREHVEETENVSPDQVMVCLSSRGPNSEMLLRYASRLAGRLNRNWYAVYVQTPSEAPNLIDTVTQQALSGTLTLAKELGALVFTYKGEDVVETVLRFAREYRVGHVVIGSPGKASWWKRLAGTKDLVGNLIENARGLTIVVVDTRGYGLASDEDSQKMAPVKEPEFKTPSALGGFSFSQYLTDDRIVFWDYPVTKEKVLGDLALVTISGATIDSELLRGKLMNREQASSTFLNEGVAFPHARLTGLSEPLISLGIAKHGVTDSLTAEPVKLVFMILTSEEQPVEQVTLLGGISRALKNRHLVQSLTNAQSAGEAYQALCEAEALNLVSNSS
ncbi:MAG: PTS sugar transporter subunit IIA [Syntrophaceae bacterium]|nr:PTS sugar transporter subunit IIA [Syntrophaceae bacterium]